ncbi:uncharacterized protein [Onthophagus taurus]|uniref:uncharacterized protein isoform X1 n=1 Tax=Onthophagus taurus TaxID=166361 RepID=UPI0039BE2B02
MYTMEYSSNSCSSSEWEEDLENVATCLAISESKKKKSYWVHEINKKRNNFGEYHRLVKELEEYPKKFHMYFRMSKEQFEFVHDIIKNKIQKKSTQFRDPISTQERLAVCLRFLATGNSFRSITFNYRLGFSTVRKIVAEVCDAIWETLGSTVFPTPTEENWKKVAERFNLLWNFPNCIGAIDGKHINIRCPINGGSSFYNYKGNHSIVLLALVDAEYKFISIDVGFYGRNSDGNIFSRSMIGKKLEDNSLHVPQNASLLENGEAQPYVIVGDEAFPLKSYLLRPYSKHYLTNNEPNKIFNYRLSRARRVVENAFGILAARWRVFQKPLEVQPTMVDKIVLASCSLHNMLCSDAKCDPNNTLLELQPEPHLTALQDVDNLRRNCTQTAFQVRENFKEYFNSRTGSVSWQTDIVRRGRIVNENN